MKRKWHQEHPRRIHAEKKLEATEVELGRAKDDLEIERGLTDYLKEQRLCRDCNRRLLD